MSAVEILNLGLVVLMSIVLTARFKVFSGSMKLLVLLNVLSQATTLFMVVFHTRKANTFLWNNYTFLELIAFTGIFILILREYRILVYSIFSVLVVLCVVEVNIGATGYLVYSITLEYLLYIIPCLIFYREILSKEKEIDLLRYDDFYVVSSIILLLFGGLFFYAIRMNQPIWSTEQLQFLNLFLYIVYTLHYLIILLGLCLHRKENRITS